MRQDNLKFFKRSAEFLRIDPGLMSFPATFAASTFCIVKSTQRKKGTRRKVYDLRYIGMSVTGIKDRLRSHRKAKRKLDQWTHFSVFEVWDNVTDKEISELEGLGRHPYRFDPTASTLNICKRLQASQEGEAKKSGAMELTWPSTKHRQQRSKDSQKN